MPLMMVWRQGKHGGGEAASYAFAQLCALSDKWRAEDRACGRDPSPVVTAKMNDTWRAEDWKRAKEKRAAKRAARALAALPKDQPPT